MRKFLLITIVIVLSNYGFGQRDTLIIHKKENFKILENQFGSAKYVMLSAGDYSDK